MPPMPGGFKSMYHAKCVWFQLIKRIRVNSHDFNPFNSAHTVILRMEMNTNDSEEGWTKSMNHWSLLSRSYDVTMFTIITSSTTRPKILRLIALVMILNVTELLCISLRQIPATAERICEPTKRLQHLKTTYICLTSSRCLEKKKVKCHFNKCMLLVCHRLEQPNERPYR